MTHYVHVEVCLYVTVHVCVKTKNINLNSLISASAELKDEYRQPLGWLPSKGSRLLFMCLPGCQLLRDTIYNLGSITAGDSDSLTSDDDSEKENMLIFRWK